MTSYSLLDEPWIPCLDSEGHAIDLGVVDVMERAHELREIRAPSPIVTLTLHRLLLAVIHDVFGPHTLAEWHDLWIGRRFDPDRVAYLRREGERERWDLFHPQHPFYQDVTLDEATTKRVPLAKLARERGSILFERAPWDDGKGTSPGVAAQLLLADQWYALPDGSGYKTSPVTYGVSVLARGDTLFETLMLNALPYNSNKPIPSSLRIAADGLPMDRPWWRTAQVRPREVPMGWLDYLTRPYRRIRLLPETTQGGELVVRYVLRASGEGLDKQWMAGLIDPVLTYRASQMAGYEPVRVGRDRALWRDAPSLFSFLRHRDLIEPGYLKLIANVGIARPSIDVFGTEADQNSVQFWLHQRLPLPPAYLDADDAEPLRALERALTFAEEAGALLDTRPISVPGLKRPETAPLELLARDLVDDDPKKWEARQAFVRDSLGGTRVYWAALEPHFRALLEGLPAEDHDANGAIPPGARTLAEWRKAVREAAEDAFDSAVGGLLGSRRGVTAVGAAESEFQRHLRRIFAPYREEVSV